MLRNIFERQLVKINLKLMFIYNIKIAMRRLWKNRLFSFINFIGLVLGFVSTFCIISYLLYEKNYDRQNLDNDLSYRLIAENKVGNLSDKS